MGFPPLLTSRSLHREALSFPSVFLNCLSGRAKKYMGAEPQTGSQRSQPSPPTSTGAGPVKRIIRCITITSNDHEKSQVRTVAFTWLF
jgi:hypothetical protein